MHPAWVQNCVDQLQQYCNRQSLLHYIGQSKVRTQKMNFGSVFFGHLFISKFHLDHSRCKTTSAPISPNITVLSQGCSLNKIVTYPTSGA